MEDVMIPQEKSAAVTRGLREAFGVTEFEDIRELTGLGSNPVFRIVVRGSAFLLRINLRAGDVARHYTCMNAAADAGVAPRVWYTSTEDRISITDFVEKAPFPPTEALILIPRVLRTLHALPPFARVEDRFNTTCMFLMNKGPALDQFIRSFQAANVLPKDESEELFAWYAQIAAVYPRHDADVVSSHNDLFKPDNILFDGYRVWLVDWEAAFLNDRYADLAAAANLVVTNDTEEKLYLKEYFGEAPDEYQLARFFVMRQLVHIFYTMAFLFLGSSGGPVDRSENPPEFNAFQRRMWAGEVNLADKDIKVVYGIIHWQRLRDNMRQARFNEALRIVSDRHAYA
jgi:thiamine kinase-like enzyme